MAINWPVEAGFTGGRASTDAGARRWKQGLAVAATAGLLMVGAAGPAAAAPGDTSSDTTEANVLVTSAIVLSGLTPAFTLTGLPGATVGEAGAVTMTVTTNNTAGYSVTVQAGSATLVPDLVGNPDSIPIANLQVRESSGTPGAYTSLSDAAPVLVHTQDTRSAQAGDSISNDYQVNIPFVNEDNYSTVLTYVATADF